MNLNNEQYLRVSLKSENFRQRVTNHIRKTPVLEDLLTVIAAEFRSFLNIDRVMIYKFHLDSSGQVIAESTDVERLPSLLGLNFPADDIPPEARELFIKSRVRSVVNVDSRQIGQSPLRDILTGEMTSEEIRYRSVNPCHVEYLTAMGVNSSVIVPIFCQDNLWGLLASHHQEPRSVTQDEIELVQIVVDQLSVAITRDMLTSQINAAAKREAVVNHIANLLHTLPTIEFQSALKEAVVAFSGSGGRLCMRDGAFNFHNDNNINTKSFLDSLEAPSDEIKIYTHGQQPVMPELSRYRLMERYSVWEEHYKSGDYDVWAISDIYQIPELRNLQVAFRPTAIRSLLMIPLYYRQDLLGYLSIFRNEIETEILWAGQCDTDQRQLFPRISFEVWREQKKALTREWTVEETKQAQDLGKQFATAIHEYHLSQQVRILSNNLENQVHSRATILKQAVEQQHVLFEVVSKIRQSLDIDTIFQTTTKEVCQLLQAERIAVYRFYSDWGGEFVHDFELTDSVQKKLVKLDQKIVWNDTCLQQTQGGRYRHNETFVVDNIHNMGFTPCHIELLEQFQIKAFVIAPILVGQKLWGLFAAYQHSQPRHWVSSEIQFMSQTATQLGVALQQAELLAQTQQQAEDLKLTAQRQQVLLRSFLKLRESFLSLKVKQEDNVAERDA